MKKQFLKSLMGAVALLCALSTSALSATMNYLGTWSNTTTYATGSVIVYNKGIFYGDVPNSVENAETGVAG